MSMERVIDLSRLGDVLATPYMQALLDRVRQKGGWALVLFCRVRLAELAREDSATKAGPWQIGDKCAETENYIDFMNERLDKYGEPPREFSANYLAEQEALYLRGGESNRWQAVQDVRDRYYPRTPVTNPRRNGESEAA